MIKFKPIYLAGVISASLFVSSCKKDTTQSEEKKQTTSINKLDVGLSKISGSTIIAPSRVFATGLNNPRGLKFGPDGNLYVAEGGLGGTNSTVGFCTQVVAPVGPYTSSNTSGRISKINWMGVRTTVVDNLPSSQTSAALGNLISGVADVAFIGHNLYAVLSGAGCSHGVPNLPNGVVKITGINTWTLIANLSAFQQSHPVMNPEPDDFEPDGTWYSMISSDNKLYALEPNHGELDRISTSGTISRVIDISASQGHIVPTAMIEHNNKFYVGNLNTFPIVPGSSNIYKIDKEGHIKIHAKGFNTVLGLTFDQCGRLYVLENTSGAPGPTPGFGNIIRVNHNGSRDTIAKGLFLPTGMTLGPDGKLYVSNWGFGPPAIGGGQILQIDISKCNKNDSDEDEDEDDD